jgi:hypothetical protein
MWWKKVVFGNFFLSAIVINVVSCIGILILRGFLPPIIPLLYGRPEGVEQLTQPLWLFIAPGISLVITFVNLSLSNWSTDVFLKKILAVTALTVSLINLITVIKIVLLVGFF